MRPHSALLALAAATSLTVAVVLPPVPDEFGLFIGHNYDNGTLVLESLSNPTLAPIVTQHESKRADPTVLTRSAKFGLVAKSVPLDKRRTDCWGSRLDSSGVDDTINSLVQWAGNGHELRTGSRQTVFVGTYSEAVVTYYCISQPNSVGNLDSNDVWYAHNQMNGACGQYIAGWFGWPGSVEIVGRAREGSEICLTGGPF